MNRQEKKRVFGQAWKKRKLNIHGGRRIFGETWTETDFWTENKKRTETNSRTDKETRTKTDSIGQIRKQEIVSDKR